MPQRGRGRTVTSAMSLILVALGAGGCGCPCPAPEEIGLPGTPMPWTDPHYAMDLPATTPDSRAAERAAGGWKLFIRHHENRKRWVTEQEVDYLVIGDSITFQWSRSAKAVWQKVHGHRKAVNIGSSGDRTEHMLWHIREGGLAGMADRNPKVVQLLIGTNNRGDPTLGGRDTAAGILALLKEIHHRLPRSKILLMALFPRGWAPEDKGRLRNQRVNDIIRDYADGETVLWVDLGHLFLDADGNLRKDRMKDGLHPTLQGYEAWAEVMEPLLVDLLGESP